jgi:quercetin dioxygenase-like cupin family protein
MKGDYSINGYEQIVEGVKIKTLCKDDSMLMSQFVLKKGACLPLHSHPNVQSGYLLKGKIRLHINEEERELLPGSTWCIQKGLKHWAEILEDSVAIEVFHPEKENYSHYEYDVELVP